MHDLLEVAPAAVINLRETCRLRHTDLPTVLAKASNWPRMSVAHAAKTNQCYMNSNNIDLLQFCIHDLGSQNH